MALPNSPRQAGGKRALLARSAGTWQGVAAAGVCGGVGVAVAACGLQCGFRLPQVNGGRRPGSREQQYLLASHSPLSHPATPSTFMPSTCHGPSTGAVPQLPRRHVHPVRRRLRRRGAARLGRPGGAGRHPGHGHGQRRERPQEPTLHVFGCVRRSRWGLRRPRTHMCACSMRRACMCRCAWQVGKCPLAGGAGLWFAPARDSCWANGVGAWLLGAACAVRTQ